MKRVGTNPAECRGEERKYPGYHQAAEPGSFGAFVYMLTHIPRDIPVFFALAAGLGLATFGFAELNSTARPSSTSALVYVFLPIWSLVFAGLAFAVGVGIRAAWWRFFPETQLTDRYRWVLPSLLSILLVTAAACGVFHAVQTEKEAQAAVLVDSGKLERVAATHIKGLVRAATPVDLDKQASAPIVWGSNVSEFIVGNSQAQLRDRASSHQVVVSITALNYITGVHAVPITLAQHAPPGLAVIMTGRATGGRALLIVLGPDYEVLLEERLVRFWDLKSHPLEVRTDLTSGDEAIVVGPGCAESFGLRSRKAAQPSPSGTTPSRP